VYPYQNFILEENIDPMPILLFDAITGVVSRGYVKYVRDYNRSLDLCSTQEHDLHRIACKCVKRGT